MGTILCMYLEGIRCHANAKQQVEKRSFAHSMIPHCIGTRYRLENRSKTSAINRYYVQITDYDLINSLIAEDVINCVKDVKSCILLRERTRYV